MAKSYEKQLQDAIKAGDLEMAKAILEKIEEKEKRNPESKQPKSKGKKLILPKDEEEEETQVPPSQNRRIARREKVPKRTKFVNKFNPSGITLPKKYEELDKKLARSDSTIQRRPAAKKVKVNCDGCRRPCEVYQSEIMMTYDDNARAYTFYKCDRCMRGGR